MTIVHSESADGRCAAAFDDVRRRRRGPRCSISRAQLRFTDAGQTTRYGPPGAAWRSDDDRLPRLAEAHVVGEDGAAAAEQERDAFDLMREEPVAERDGLPEGAVRVVRRQAEQLREGGGLCVEGFIRRSSPRGDLTPRGSMPRLGSRPLSAVSRTSVMNACSSPGAYCQLTRANLDALTVGADP